VRPPTIGQDSDFPDTRGGFTKLPQDGESLLITETFTIGLENATCEFPNRIIDFVKRGPTIADIGST
jgi:hypothetical protein